MLEKVNLEKRITKETYKKEIAPLKEELSNLQHRIKEQKIPVIVLFEGWSAAGKGSFISDVIRNLDPRGYKVQTFAPPSESERRMPLLWRYWAKIPEQGQFAIFDRSWYQQGAQEHLEDGVTDKAYKRRLESFRIMERQLTDNGTVIVKFFLHVSKETQEERFNRLEADKNTLWRVTETDWKRNRQYVKYRAAFDEMLEETDTEYAPWHAVASDDRYTALSKIYKVLVKSVREAVEAKERQAQREAEEKEAAQDPAARIVLPYGFNLKAMPRLTDIDLSVTISEEEYDKQLKKLQKKLRALHNQMYEERRPAIIAYEGWDAAGKGGNIKRVSAALDPRGYEVIPIAAPDKHEASRHYLWRFWQHIPKDGHIAIFDRTWYGRVMVERIEGFCSEEDWQRAYREINEFEKELYNWGAVIVKFWLQIDQDEQLRRFTDRQNTPEKQWKITDEDWRNREKWPYYELAVDDMLRYTSTDFAPWHIIESNDKKYARIKALKVLVKAIESRL